MFVFDLVVLGVGKELAGQLELSDLLVAELGLDDRIGVEVVFGGLEAEEAGAIVQFLVPLVVIPVLVTLVVEDIGIL